MDMFRKFLPLLKNEKLAITGALCATLINSGLNLLAPVLIGHAVDTYIVTKSYPGVLQTCGILLACYLGALLAGYIQTRVMGGVGQRVLLKLRNGIFMKLQELPVAFFNQNKAGDLISRINNDTDKLNQFFSQALMQFMGNAFVILGAGIFLIALHPTLGGAALMPALVLLIITRLISPWIKLQNTKNLQTTGGLSANIQESLENFKVIVAFNRRDYFRDRLRDVNENNYRSGVLAGVANTVFTPLYGFSSTVAQLIVLGYGTYLITAGSFTLGLMISYLSYVNRFYDPLRQIASVWSSFQLALASWERVSGILSMESDIKILPSSLSSPSSAVVPLLSFHNVRFGYPDGKEVLHNVNLSLEAGKTYALVGPTGGGKTTTASLMARLYDPTEGTVMFHGADLRSYPLAERTKKIGFILQEPFLFTGTVRDNILYGHEEYRNITNDELVAVLQSSGLHTLIERFEQGLATPVSSSKDATSLGQRQLIAFIRAALRKPELLILDEATANIDTVTEQLLQEILEKLPKETTRVIIAHRLNTIENADEIYFVNEGEVKRAGSLNDAVNMLMHGKRKS
ncbi:MAG: ABC transporter ATP-binding protein [Patescibacteria group bacterium]